MLDISFNMRYDKYYAFYGDIAQLARACGSYPQCHWFEPSYRYQPARWSSGQDTALSRRYREFDSRTGHQKPPILLFAHPLNRWMRVFFKRQSQPADAKKPEPRSCKRPPAFD